MNVLGFAGYSQVQGIAFALLGTDLNFFFSPSISHRKEQLVTGVRKLTTS